MKKFLIALMLLAASTVYAAESEVVSLNLADCIELALKNNQTIAQSMQDREVARWQYKNARRQSGPTLSYNFSGRRYGQSSDGFKQTDNDFNNSLTLSIPIYQGGRLKNLRRQTKYALDSAELTLEDTKQAIKMQTTQAYYEILRCRDMLNVRQEEVNALQEHLNKSMIRYREGVVAKSDILASTVSLADAKQNYVTARGDYEKSLANLNNIIGLPTETPLLIREQMHYTTYEPTEQTCLEYALENRPDYLSAEYAIKQAEAAIKIAESDRKPRLDASISKTAEGDRIFKADSRNWQAGVSLQWNIFDNAITSAGINEMRARLKKCQSIATQIADSIRLEVHNDYIDLRTAEENIATTQIAVARAEEDYHLAQIRYVEGVGTNLEVIDAQEKLTQARTNYFSALYGYYVAKASLEKAMGVPVDIDMPVAIQAGAEKSFAHEHFKSRALSG